MGKNQRKTSAEPTAATNASLPVSSTSFDPVLSSLFASSAGPVKVPERPVANTTSQKRQQAAVSDLPTPETTPSEAESSSEPDGSESSEGEAEPQQEPPRKRRRVENDELEDTYFRKLANAEQRDLQQRKRQEPDQDDDDEVSDSPSNDLEDLSDDEDAIDEDQSIPVHESLAGTEDKDLTDKTSRTIFLSNVSTAVIKEKASKKALLAHLESAIPKDPPAKIESVRFRSTPYASGVGPKRAAYATKALMDETAASTHAYVVLSSEAAARAIVSKLNGTVVLDRHLHVDQLGAPSQTDHRRCVFVGNLPFVDEETLETPDDENPRKRPRAKLRADAEEGLWQTFSKAGKVENVRMVRDKTTRIGKGFAYVQFTNENAVEAALLMHDKKFPPLLPRKLRVLRSKTPSTKPKHAQSQFRARGKPEENKGRGKAVQKTRDRGAKKDKNLGRDIKKIVFEGHRASKASAKDNAVKTKSKKKPKTRSANRGAAFKAGGGKKKRDMK